MFRLTLQFHHAMIQFCSSFKRPKYLHFPGWAVFSWSSQLSLFFSSIFISLLGKKVGKLGKVTWTYLFIYFSSPQLPGKNLQPFPRQGNIFFIITRFLLISVEIPKNRREMQTFYMTAPPERSSLYSFCS